MIPCAISPRAKQDLDEIWDYIARDNSAAADRMMALFEQKFLLLSSQPLIGESCDRLQTGLRSFCIGNYVVFYLPMKDSLEVARVIHAARDFNTQF
jgi:toxin ParE1/3/4